MSVKRVDDCTLEYSVRRKNLEGLRATVRTSDQYVTVYNDKVWPWDKPMGTLQRKRHNESGPTWSVYDTEGKLVAQHAFPSKLMWQLAKHLDEKGE